MFLDAPVRRPDPPHIAPLRPAGHRGLGKVTQKEAAPLRLRYDTGSVERICSARS